MILGDWIIFDRFAAKSFITFYLILLQKKPLLKKVFSKSKKQNNAPKEWGWGGGGGWGVLGGRLSV